MISIIFFILGLILMAVGILVYFVIGGSLAKLPIDPLGIPFLTQYGVSGLLALLGFIFFLVGLIGLIRRSKKSKFLAHIAQTGIETDATVTFVDKNYSILVNHKPIYSIVEYTYKDESGNVYVRKINDLPSDWVIRNKIQVGNTVKVKYLHEDPKQSTLLMIG